MATFSYADVQDYELRTGVDVPTEAEDTYQVRLDDASNLIALYLGECEEPVSLAYPEVLAALTCSMVFRFSSIPAGVRSKSIGATSVSYQDEASSGQKLLQAEMNLLNDLMRAACPDTESDEVPGLGCVGANWGGWTDPADHWARDIDMWVL